MTEVPAQVRTCVRFRFVFPQQECERRTRGRLTPVQQQMCQQRQRLRTPDELERVVAQRKARSSEERNSQLGHHPAAALRATVLSRELRDHRFDRGDVALDLGRDFEQNRLLHVLMVE